VVAKGDLPPEQSEKAVLALPTEIKKKALQQNSMKHL
jgi:hypothetical protein